METIRRNELAFASNAKTYSIDTSDDMVMCIVRELGEEKIVGIFNFSNSQRTAWITEDGTYKELVTGKKVQIKNMELAPYEFQWLKK